MAPAFTTKELSSTSSYCVFFVFVSQLLKNLAALYFYTLKNWRVNAQPVSHSVSTCFKPFAPRSACKLNSNSHCQSSQLK